MFLRCLLFSCLLYGSTNAFAQMKIGNNPTVLNSSSLLELESTNRGFVLPHIALSSINLVSPLSSGALNGTLVYNTNNTIPSGNGRGIYYWDSTNTRWIPVTPYQTPGVTNYVAKWTNPSTIGVSTILYDNGTNIGINTTTPLNSLDVSGAQAIGSYAGLNTAPANGLIVSGNTGIGTASPLTGAKIDVAGGFKLGIIGTLHKNIISFSGSVNATVPPQFSAVTVVGITVLTLNGGTNYTDVTLTVPATLTNTLDNVFVAPTFDLPQGVAIAFARVVSTTQIKIRFVNANTSSQTVTGNFIVTVLDL